MPESSAALTAYRSMTDEARATERTRQEEVARAARASVRDMYLTEAFLLAREVFPQAVTMLWSVYYDFDTPKGFDVWRLLDAEDNVVYGNTDYDERFAGVAYNISRWLNSAFEMADGVSDFDDWDDGNRLADFDGPEDAQVVTSRFA